MVGHASGACAPYRFGAWSVVMPSFPGDSSSAASSPPSARVGRFLRWMAGRSRLAYRTVALMTVFTAPAIVDRLDARERSRFVRESVPAPRALTRPSRLIDSLLPEGAGGTFFVKSLPDAQGLANGRGAFIALAVDGVDERGLESVEVHERAHLLHAQLDTLVQAVLDRYGAPAPNEYAATNAHEHFAEMAQGAWTLITPADFCFGDTPAERVARADSLVPGVAGFVLYFLAHPSIRRANLEASALHDAALARTAHARTEWTRLFAALEQRQQADGTLAPWPVPSTADWLARERRLMRAEGTLRGKLQAAVLWPGSLFVDVFGL